MNSQWYGKVLHDRVLGDKLDFNPPLDQLKTLTGMGDACSQKIIAGRPWCTMLDLVHRKINPHSTSDSIMARTSPCNRSPVR